MDNCIQVFIEPDLWCWINLETLQVYSARLHLLKPQHMTEHCLDYYMIKQNGKKRYLSLNTIIDMANKQKQQGVNK